MSEPAKAAAVPVWHCEFKPLQVPLANLTVGAKFEMDCGGDISVTWKGRPEIRLPDNAPEYSLYLLETPKLDANAVELIVTSYRPGHAKPDFIRVMSGDVGFEAGDLQWDVQSVVKAQQGQPPPKPFGPYGPFVLPLPGWVWLMFACVLAAILSVILIWIRRVQQRRRLQDDLANFSQPALTPSAQFHKELRQLSRKLNAAADAKEAPAWVEALDRSLRGFLLREYRFLTFKASRSQLFKRFRRIDSAAYEQFHEGLQKIFSEMDRFLAHAGQHQPADFEQILQIARRWCDDIEKQKVKRT